MYKLDTKLNHFIYIKNDINDNIFFDLPTKDYDKVYILTHKSIFNLHLNNSIFSKGYELIQIDFEKGIKSLDTVENIIGQLSVKKCTRNSLLIGVGGGVITDLAGFTASIYMRGIDHILIPTSLLAMVDAAIGGKTGINIQSGKNLIGTFKRPKGVYVDSGFLKTLDKKNIINGFAEILKYSLIKDKKLFFTLVDKYQNLIELNDLKMINEIIIQCCEGKAQIVAKDEHDKNSRMILNFGHTIGHAIESYYEYNYISHGEAVYYGILAASFISYKLNYLSKNDFKKIENFIIKVPLPSLKKIDSLKLLDYIQYDKKQKGNKFFFIILNNIGDCLIKNNISNNLIKEAIQFITN